jgi:AcrR family transcriptional regulator
VSADERRAERRARLKHACLDLIGEAGVISVSAEAVSARAGLTKRYFYESFADREALLAEVIDDFFTEVRSEMLDALARTEHGPKHRAHTIGQVLIDFLQRDARRARLYVEAPGQPTLRPRQERAFDTFTRLLLDTFPVKLDPARDAEQSKAIEHRRALVALIVVAGTTQAAIAWLRGDVDLTRGEVIDEIAGTILGALTAATVYPSS